MSVSREVPVEHRERAKYMTSELKSYSSSDGNHDVISQSIGYLFEVLASNSKLDKD